MHRLTSSRRVLASCLRRWKTGQHSKAPQSSKEEKPDADYDSDFIPAFVGDTQRGLVEAMERADQRMQTEWLQATSHFEDEEDSPSYFADGHPADLIFRIDPLKAGTVKWPLIPEVDARKLSNQDVQQGPQQHKVAKYCKKYGLHKIFPKLNFEVNLNVSFSDMYWHSVFYGNYLPPSTVQAPPEVFISADETPAVPTGSYFTLMMFTPDYPFRTAPEQGHLLHWMICNVGMGAQKGHDTVVDYLPPLPTEYAGHFRYIFALFLQDKGKLKLPAAPPSQHYALNQRRNFFLHSRRFQGGSEDQNIAYIQQHLNPVPTAVTFFHSSYDIEVTEYYQKHELQEPVFTPNNVLPRLLMHDKYARRNEYKNYRKVPLWSEIWPKDFPRYKQ